MLSPYKYLIDVAIVLALMVGVHFYNDHQQGIGAARVQAQWDKATADATAKALADTKQLQADKEAIRKERDATVSALNASLAAAIAGLRERPARDSQGSVPVDPTTGAKLGSTGADLLRQDAEFLVRESSRADRLRADLIECQAAYSKARDALK